MKSTPPLALALTITALPVLAQNQDATLVNGVNGYIDVPANPSLIPRRASRSKPGSFFNNTGLNPTNLYPTIARKNVAAGAGGVLLPRRGHRRAALEDQDQRDDLADRRLARPRCRAASGPTSRAPMTARPRASTSTASRSRQAVGDRDSVQRRRRPPDRQGRRPGRHPVGGLERQARRGAALVGRPDRRRRSSRR